MAKKDNTLFWVAALGIGGYLYYQYTQKQAATPGTSTAPNASGGTLLLPASTATASNAPASGSGNAPNTNAVNTTNLVPVAVNAANQPVLQPGQTLAINNNGSIVTNNAGQPMVFVGPEWNNNTYTPGHYIPSPAQVSGLNEYCEEVL